MSIRDLNQYEIIKDEDLQDVKCHGYLLKHKKSGARLVLMEADDDNKVFSVGFRTPPEDIFWSIRYCVALIISRSRIRL